MTMGEAFRLAGASLFFFGLGQYLSQTTEPEEYVINCGVEL